MPEWAWTALGGVAFVVLILWIANREPKGPAKELVVEGVRRMWRTMTLQESEVLKMLVDMPDTPDCELAEQLALRTMVGEDLYRRAADRLEGLRQKLDIPQSELKAIVKKELGPAKGVW